MHQQLITRMLSDCYGIQARGGCACAGPYVHQLLEIDAAQSKAIREQIIAGNELRKPGFTQIEFLASCCRTRKVNFIIESVAQLSRDAPNLASNYTADAGRAIFSPQAVGQTLQTAL